MNVIVCVRRVPDPDAAVRLTRDGQRDRDGVAMLLDPVDAAALEAAVRLVEAHGGESTVLTAGPGDEGEEEVLRTALAHGATRAVMVEAGAVAWAAQAAASLAHAIELAPEAPTLVLCGSRSSDFHGGSTAAALAARLRFPVVQNVVAIRLVADDDLIVERKRDGGYREVVRVRLPAVLATEQSIARPRFPTTLARLHARRATIARVVAPPAPPGEGAATHLIGYRSPAPQLSGIVWPDRALDARERLRFLVQGGAARANTSRLVTGDPRTVASALVDYIRERGYVTSQ